MLELNEIVPTSNIIAAPEIGTCGTDIWNFANINEKLNNMFYNNFSQNWQDKIAVSNWSIYGIEYDKLMMDNKTIYDYEVGKLSYKGNYEDMQKILILGILKIIKTIGCILHLTIIGLLQELLEQLIEEILFALMTSQI